MAFLFNFFKRPELAFKPMTTEQYKSEASGKAFLIVGGTKGIGAALARALVQNGAKVTVAGRSKGEETPSEAEFLKYDASLLSNGLELANSLKQRKYDTVVFTVGIITRSQLTRTPEGVEEDLAVSYMSRFVLANELIKAGVIEGRKRIYIMGYPGEDIEPVDINDINFETVPYKQFPAHMNTVAFNEALTYELARRYSDYHLYGLNPGLIRTGIRDNLHGGDSSFMGKTIETLIGLTQQTVDQYVERALLPLVLTPDIESKSGVSFSKKGELVEKSKWTAKPENTLKAWEASQNLLSKSVKGAPVY